MFASLISQILQKFGYKTSNLFNQIRGRKTQNFAWEPGLSDSSNPNYDKKSGSQLLLKMPVTCTFSQNIARLWVVLTYIGES